GHPGLPRCRRCRCRSSWRSLPPPLYTKGAGQCIADEMTYPRMLRVRQRFDGPRIADVPGAVHAEFERTGLLRGIRPGGSVAITVGSRGIRDIVAVVRTLVGLVRAAGGSPFLVPAMGSHGGATAEGQRRIVEEL